MDLINRAKLIEEIVSTESEVAKNSPFVQEWFVRLADRQHEIIEIIKNAPIIESRPKGKWIKAEQNTNEWYCSECKGIHNDPETGKWRDTFTYKYAFCPLCGADMRGEE